MTNTNAKPIHVTGTVTDTKSLSVRGALSAGVEGLQGSPTARRDAELLLMHAIDCDRASLLTHPDRFLSSEELARYSNLIERRSASEPIQYILGEQEFYGLRFEVNRDVLIPRPETEHLIEALLARLPKDQPVHIADVGTGSGAIAVALAYHLHQARVTALDNSPAALTVARRNAELHQVQARITFLESDLLTATESGARFDAIVSNPPYVADGELLEAQVRNFEPHAALFAGPTGLEIYQRLIPEAHRQLNPGCWLLLEIGAGQRPAIEQLLSAWNEVNFTNDIQGIPRVAIARRS